MTLRDDGAATLEWLASYLESVRERPVLSRVEPGAIRAALPERAPEAPEPFAVTVAVTLCAGVPESVTVNVMDAPASVVPLTGTEVTLAVLT